MSAARTLFVLCPGLLASLLLVGACARTTALPPPAGPSAAACQWPREPAPATAELVAAAGDDAIALAMVHADAWIGLKRRLLLLDEFSAVSRGLPWLAGDDLWPLLRELLGLSAGAGALSSAPLSGWDATRPLALALVGTESRGLLQEIGARLFDGASSPLHVRVIVPASDGAALARSLAAVLSALAPGATTPNRYLLDTSHRCRTGVAVVPARDHVRLELLYSLGGDNVDRDLRAALERAAAPPRRRVVATDPIAHLLANGHGAAVSFRPRQVAHELLLGGPVKVRSALAAVDPRYSTQLMAMGASEILEGYLVTSAGEAELDEVAYAVKLDDEIGVVALARPTAAGRRQLGALVGHVTTPIASSPEALVSVALATPGADLAKAVAPLFSPAFPVSGAKPLFRHVQDAGTAGWPALLARPAGLVRTLLGQGPEPPHRPITSLPSDVVFEVLDFTGDGPPVARVLARLPAGQAEHERWLGLLGGAAREVFDAPEAELEQEQRPDGSWASWTMRMPGAMVPASQRTQLPAGTFSFASVRPAAIVARMAQHHPDPVLERGPAAIARQLDRVDLALRWQNGWLVAELNATSVGSQASARCQLAIPAEQAVPVEVAPSPDRLVLEGAVVSTYQALAALANVAPRQDAELVVRAKGEIGRQLAPLSSDEAVRNEAAALIGMLDRFERMFAENAAREAKQHLREPPPDVDLPGVDDATSAPKRSTRKPRR